MLNKDFSDKVISTISTLLAMSLFMWPQFVTYFLCAVGVVFLLYLVIIKKERLIGKIIPFIFYMFVLCSAIFYDIQK